MLCGLVSAFIIINNNFCALACFFYPVKEYNWDTVRQIEITTLDKLIEQHGKPVFIKIDVEGYELEVLNGLSKQIKMICFEYTVPEQTEQAIACVRRLYSINSGIECNYSVSDSMDFELENWMEVISFMKCMESKKFIESGFGDIYIRSKILMN